MNEPIRILLVDDSSYFLQAARDFLHYQELLAVVGIATDVEEAIDQAQKLKPDIILLDLNLARSSGLDLIPMFKRDVPETKIIVLTMMEEAGYRAAAMQAGADEFVPKNDMSRKLVTAIHGLIKRSASAPVGEQTEAALRIGVEPYQSFLEDISELICRFLPDGTLTYVNTAYCRYYGNSREELIGTNFIASAADDFPEKLHEHFKSFTPDRPTSTFEQYDVRPDGQKRWREWVDRALFSPDGRVLEFQSTGRDITERKQAESQREAALEALHDREAQLAGLIKSTLDAIVVIDAEQRITLFNPAAEQLLRCPASEAVGSRLERFIPEIAREQHQDYVRAFGRSNQTRRSMRTPNLEVNCLRADGELFPSEISISQFEVNGHKHFIASIRDITERKQAEQAVRESEERYRAIFNGVRDAIFVETLSGQILDVNASACDMFGFRREEFLGKQVVDLVPPGQPVIMLNDPAWQDFLDRPVETINLRANGEPFPVEINGRLQTIGGETRLLVVVRDITERKQRQHELEALVTVAAALRAAPTRGDMLPVIVDHTLSLLKAQGASLVMCLPKTGETIVALARGVASHLTGLRLPPGQGISSLVMSTGRPYFNDDIHADRLEIFPAPIDAANMVACVPLMAEGQATGALWALWVERHSAITSGELRLLMAIADIAGNALHRASMVETLEQRVVDRTQELAQANERLQELDRLKSKFVSDVSHELRTPITSLSLYVDLLDHGKPEKQADYKKGLTQQVNRLRQLVEDILNLSRLELGASRIQWEPVELNALVDAAVVTHEPGAEAAGLQLGFTPGADLPLVRGEHNQLAQVVTNLIGNAINYTRQGAVQVRTFRRDDRVCLEIQDSGLGIDPEDVPHLFDRFYRGKQAVKSAIRGSGLGLAIVKEIVDLHGGEIELESVIHVGTAFRVWLPMMDH